VFASLEGADGEDGGAHLRCNEEIKQKWIKKIGFKTYLIVFCMCLWLNYASCGWLVTAGKWIAWGDHWW